MNRAQRALDCVQNRPDDAVRWSVELLDDPTATPSEQASASWALGRAYAELSRLDRAMEALRQGMTLAAEHGLDELEADIRISLATCLLLAGSTEEALAELSAAGARVRSDGARGRLAMQRGFIEMHRGALTSAVSHFDTADTLLTGGADELARTRLLLNRGIAQVMLGQVGRGHDDFLAARGLADELGQHLLAAGAAQNLGFAAGRRGDTPTALRWFTEARTRYEKLGTLDRATVTLEIDSCSVYLAGGLYAEATGAAQRAVALASRTGNRLDEAEARLLLARAHLANGSPNDGEREAELAGALFRQSNREAWVAQSDHVALLAFRQTARPGDDLLERAVAAAERLQANGWRREALEVRTFAGRMALTLGRVEQARTLLEPLIGGVADGSAALRANAWLATALLRLADGDRAGAKAALSSGMTVVEEHRSTLGSSELRAHASVNAAELADLGLALAVEDGDPLEVMMWAERWHAGALQSSPVQRPGPDDPLAMALVELREVHTSVMTGSSDPFDEADPDQRIAELERRVRDLGRVVGAGRGPLDLSGSGPDLDGLRRLLDTRCLVEYVTVADDLHAIVADGDDVTLHRLGPMTEITEGVHRMVATLGRLAYGGTSEASRRAACQALRATAAELDERLVAKLVLRAGAELVMVPTGSLQGLPWALLPSLDERTVTVTPSGCMWARPGPRAAIESGATNRRPLLVCGAGLPGGDAEIDLLRPLYPDATVLTGSDARVAAVTGAMAGADMVHLAAHGHFRADNPMFSSLGLHDGPLTVYDLESLDRAPTTVVLPACDGARSSVRRGDELLGTAAALLQGGVGTVVAPVTVVPTSGVVSTLMHELHRAMAGGAPPAMALTRARRALVNRHDEADVLLAGVFVAIGIHRP